MITQRPPASPVDDADLETEIDETDLVADEDEAITRSSAASVEVRAAAATNDEDTSYVEIVEITDADVVAADQIAVASFDPSALLDEEVTDDDLVLDGGEIDWDGARAPAEPLSAWWKGQAPEIAFSLDDDDEPLLVEIEQGEVTAFRRSTGLESGRAPVERRDLIWSTPSQPASDVLNVLTDAQTLLEKGRREDAALQVAIASRLSPLDLEVQERAKDLYLKLGMSASAVERLIHLAILAFDSGEKARALGYAEEALTLSPDNRGVMRIVERLV